MRFRKRVRVFPGFYLNFSMAGVSSTIGMKGASINFNKTGTYLNTGLPGSGLYNRQKISGRQKSSNNKISNIDPTIDDVLEETVDNLNEIQSNHNNELTSTNLLDIRETLLKAFQDRNDLNAEIALTKNRIKTLNNIYLVSCILLFGLFIKTFKNKVTEAKEYLVDLNTQLDNCFVNIDIIFDPEFESKYQSLTTSYKKLLTSEVIWDVTASIDHDRIESRSVATSSISRTPVEFKFDNIDLIKSKYPAFHFENKNGGDLYIYPAFMIVTTNKNEFALIDLKDTELNFSTTGFLEEGTIPSDSKVISTTWAKVNKNGQPDKRFKDNYEIPVVRYGEIHLKTKTGLNEIYKFSNCEASKGFADEFLNYKKIL